MNQPTVRRQLCDELRKLRVKNYQNEYFYPHKSIEKNLNSEQVRRVLQEAGIRHDIVSKITPQVMTGGLRTLAILMFIDRVEVILSFFENDQLQQQDIDHKLPYQRSSPDFLDADTSELIYKTQWEFSTPVFGRQFEHRVLNRRTILPILSSQNFDEGGFGILHEIELHPQQHRLDYLVSDGKLLVVRKEIKRRSPGSLSSLDENRVLSMLNALVHPNLLELIGSYTFQDTLSLIFPLAEHSLKQILFDDVKTEASFTNEDLISALPGLASALNALHNYVFEDVYLIGFHHDIKPDNILISSNKLLIADFGLSTLKEKAKGSDTYFKTGQGYYLAPECEDLANDSRKGRINRKSDIWSLGCVLLEIMIYLEDGFEAVKRFQEERKVVLGGWLTTFTFHAGSSPNSVVLRHIQRFKREDQPKYLSLMAELVEEMLNILPDRRPNAEAVMYLLRKINLKYLVSGILIQKSQMLYSDPPFDFVVERQRLLSWAHSFNHVLDFEWHDQPVIRNGDTYSATVQSCLQLVEYMKLSLQNQTNCGVFTFGIRQLLDKLIDTLDKKTQATFKAAFETEMLAMDELIASDIPTGIKGQELPYRRIASLVALKKMISLYGSTLNNSSEVSKLTINTDSFFDIKQLPNKPFAISQLERDACVQNVLIEWIWYDSKWVGKVGDILYQRISLLTRFLQESSQQKSFRVLKCLGYFHKAGQPAFGLVFGYPTHNTEEIHYTPRTLREIINGTSDQLRRPSLGQMFAIASNLAEAISEYHRINWLHKSISPDHIVFFNQSTNLIASIDHPWITGFVYSRPDKPDEYSLGPWDEKPGQAYHHPQYHMDKHRFRAEFDYFSFGLVLLEIGLWKTLKFDWKQESDVDVHLRVAYIEKLKREKLPLLLPRMGKIYHDATKACLEAVEGVDDPRRVPPWNFVETVVNPLKRCVA